MLKRVKYKGPDTTLGDGVNEPPFIDVENIGVIFPTDSSMTLAAELDEDHRIIRTPRGRLKGFRALNDISFNLKNGDRLAIVGSNGSGKTTLLQVLAGILTPNRGMIRYRGKTTNLINVSLGVQVEATGHRNITLRGLASGYSREEIEARRADIVAFSELGKFLDMPLETYSTGMKMRLVFAIATAFDPGILILDEWLSAGDASFKRKATVRMQDFVSRAGILILASHSRALLLENCNLGLWINDGEVVATGKAEDVIDQYETFQKTR